MQSEKFLAKFNRNERVIFLSDGVFAIVLTLLALELRVPEFHEKVTNGTLWNAIRQMGPHFLSFLLSFMFIASLWFTHDQVFRLFDKVDNVILWLNNLLLLMICFIPFPTAVLGRYPNTGVGITMLGTIWVITPTLVYLMARRAYNKKYLHETVDLERFKMLSKVSLMFAPLSAIPLTFSWNYPKVALIYYMMRVLLSTFLAFMVRVKQTEAESQPGAL
ncbi:MAG TPA: TMEM175 family protein [Chitinophagaceae bacterium]|nr:TMEM175 family protein [Chitinophagaceae bacterium]